MVKVGEEDVYKRQACTNASGHEERLALLEKALGEYYRGGAAVTEVEIGRAHV